MPPFLQGSQNEAQYTPMSANKMVTFLYAPCSRRTSIVVVGDRLRPCYIHKLHVISDVSGSLLRWIADRLEELRNVYRCELDKISVKPTVEV